MGIGVKGFGGSGSGSSSKLQGFTALPPAAVAAKGIFEPQGTPDEFFNNVVFLLQGDETDGFTTFTDLSNSGHSITLNGTVAWSNGSAKFGSTSMLFTDGFLSVAADADFNHNNVEHTVEAWVSFTDTASAKRDIIFKFDPIFTVDGLFLARRRGSGVSDPNVPNGQYGNQNSSIEQVRGDNTITQDEFVHYAMVRSGTTLTMFVNGIAQSDVGTVSTNFPPDSNLSLVIGTPLIGVGDNRNAQMYLESLRVTKNVARYTENFTAPTEPFPIF